MAATFGHRWAAFLLAAVCLAGCGGGGGGATSASPAAAPETSTRGRLEEAVALNVVTQAEIVAGLQKPDTRAPQVTPLYRVANYRLSYRTLDGFGRELSASGLVSVPLKPAGATSPVISYQHATIFNDVEAPSRRAQGDEAAVIIASLGYIVVAADYVGFGVSKGAEHPYLLARPTAAAVLDLLTAARTWRRGQQVADNGQLFLIGYSEGGYATMAAHRAMQAEGAADLPNLVFSMPGAGPYDVGVTLDELLRRVRAEQPVLGALINPGLLRFLGSTVRDEVRRALLRLLVPSDADVTYQADVLDRYLADDSAAIVRDSNVGDWAPQVPVYLFHGRDDQTVPFSSSTTTLGAMIARGATRVTLTECTLVPAGHKECVAPYWLLMLKQLAPVARNL
jgi:pimeloyl-ACP methyl ester carboxylesterase